MCWHSSPPLATSRLRARGQGEVKCQEQNANSCWQAVQKTCSLRLGEPWYFTKSNEHVSQHCRATIGLFKEEVQKAGRCYITGSRDCLRAAQRTRLAFVVVVILLLQFPSVCEPSPTRRVRHNEGGLIEETYWFTLVRHYTTAALSSARSAVGPCPPPHRVICLQHWAPKDTVWLTARALIHSRTSSRLKNQIQPQNWFIQAAF